MKRALKIIGKFLLCFFAVLVVGVSGTLLFIWANSSEKPEPVIDAYGNYLPQSVAIIKDTVINGAMQRLSIRGHDRSNPVLLRVHGGPGQPHPPQAFRSNGIDLEDLFTVCYWDQRGAGPAYEKEKTPDSLITKEAIVQDGLRVTEYLRRKFNQDKIYVEGASWGTVVSALMVREKPEYFKAYIGQGQVSDGIESEILSYNHALKESIKNGDTISIKALNEIGPPPYKTIEEGNKAVQVERRIVSKYTPKNTNWSTWEIMKQIFLYEGWSMSFKFNYVKSGGYGPAAPILWPEAVGVNLFEEMPEWPIPVYIIQGDSDHFTETSLAKAYYDSLKAPYKKMKIVENTGHVVFFERPKEYREFYLSEVLKLEKITNDTILVKPPTGENDRALVHDAL